MKHTIITILVGTLCFGGGVAAGAGGILWKISTEVNGTVSINQKVEDTDQEQTQDIEQEQDKAKDEANNKDQAQDQDESQDQVPQDTNQEEVKETDPVEKDTVNDAQDVAPGEEVKAPPSEEVPKGLSEWKANETYSQGSEVTYQGKVYACVQQHTALEGWEPSKVPALWAAKSK